MTYARIVKRLDGLFTRRPDGWKERSKVHLYTGVLKALEEGDIRVRLRRLPPLSARASDDKVGWQITGHGRDALLREAALTPNT